MRRCGSDRGMTLTELMVAVSLLTVVVGAGYLVFEAVVGMADLTEARSRAQEETRLAMDRITRELRQASEIPGLQGSGVFSVVTTDHVGFYCDVDHEGQLERVEYWRDGARILRSVTEPQFEDGQYVFGAAPAGTPIVTGVPADWTEGIFTLWAKSSGTEPLPLSRSAEASAISVHLRNAMTVGRKTGYSEEETLIKIRSVYNEVN